MVAEIGKDGFVCHDRRHELSNQVGKCGAIGTLEPCQTIRQLCLDSTLNVPHQLAARLGWLDVDGSLILAPPLSSQELLGL